MNKHYSNVHKKCCLVIQCRDTLYQQMPLLKYVVQVLSCFLCFKDFLHLYNTRHMTASFVTEWLLFRTTSALIIFFFQMTFLVWLITLFYWRWFRSAKLECSKSEYSILEIELAFLSSLFEKTQHMRIGFRTNKIFGLNNYISLSKTGLLKSTSKMVNLQSCR